MVNFLAGIVLLLSAIIIIGLRMRTKKREKYGFDWQRYDVRDHVHKYVGDYLYVCERVPFIDDKIKDLPKTKEDKI